MLAVINIQFTVESGKSRLAGACVFINAVDTCSAIETCCILAFVDVVLTLVSIESIRALTGKGSASIKAGGIIQARR